MVEEVRAQWGHSIEFILTVVSYAVGLGNVWRFPYLVYSNGGAAFILVFLIILVLVGIPIFFLEVAIGQFSGLGPTHVFLRMAPITQGIGYAALTINSYIGFYYNMIISYCVYYFIMSIRAKLPWSECNPDWSSAKCAVRGDMNCTTFLAKFPNSTSPSEDYFNRHVLDATDSIADLNGIVPHLALSLLASWVIVFLALAKGVQSLGKISYFTATFPYVMLTILIITGATLPNSIEGVKYYIGEIDTTKLYDPEVWQTAAAQVFFSTSACAGGLIAMSSFNKFNNNIIRDVFIVPFLDCFTGIYAGFAIFSVLGFMKQQKCIDKFKDVVKAGPSLAFIAYPEGISMIKAVPPLWSVLFFIMMLALGFGSEFSIMETFMTMVMDTFKKTLNTPRKKLLTRFGVCCVFFLLGLTMATRGGSHIWDLIDSYGAENALVFVGLFESIAIPWIYGTGNLIRDIESMVGPKPKWFWMIFTVIWRVVCPVVLLAILIGRFIFSGKKLVTPTVQFPAYAISIGWLLTAVPIAVIIGCAVAQIYNYRNDWRGLFRPDPLYYENERRNTNQGSNNSDNYYSNSTNLQKVVPMPDDNGKLNEAYESSPL